MHIRRQLLFANTAETLQKQTFERMAAAESVRVKEVRTSSISLCHSEKCGLLRKRTSNKVSEAAGKTVNAGNLWMMVQYCTPALNQPSICSSA